METRRILMKSLAVAVVIASVIWTTTALGQKVTKSCCTKVSTTEVTDPILDIKLRPRSLPCVKAVIFKTKQGEFCSDPRQEWVQEKVEKFFTSPPTASSISD